MPDRRIAVVGAGVFGSWTALLAARTGFETILIDQYGPANKLSSSAGPSRILRRAYGPEEIYTLFAHRARDMWLAFLAEENRSHCFKPTGVLWLANNGDSSIHAAREIFERHKLVHKFLESRAIRELCNGMNVPRETVALFEPECGALLAEESVRAVAESVIRHGARFVHGKVRPPRAAGPMRALDIEDAAHVEADVFVFACGSWLPKLFPDALGASIFPTRQEVFFFEPPANWAPPIWVDQTDPRIPYGFPDIDGSGLKVAFHRLGPPFDPDSGSREIADEQIAEAAEYLRLRFPSMPPAKFRRADVCHYENTSNGDLLIDRHPSIQNVWFAGGGSGHGFKHAPAVAEYLLNAISKGNSPAPRFRLQAHTNSLPNRIV